MLVRNCLGCNCERTSVKNIGISGFLVSCRYTSLPWSSSSACTPCGAASGFLCFLFLLLPLRLAGFGTAILTWDSCGSRNVPFSGTSWSDRKHTWIFLHRKMAPSDHRYLGAGGGQCQESLKENVLECLWKSGSKVSAVMCGLD